MRGYLGMIFVGSTSLLGGCAFGDLPYGYQSFKPIGQHRSGDVTGGPDTSSGIDNTGRYSGGGKGPTRVGGSSLEAGEMILPAKPTPAPAPTPAPVAATVVAQPLDIATIIDMLGIAWQTLKRPQPINPAIGKWVGGVGAAIDALQKNFDAKAVRQANQQIEAIRDSMGPGETKFLHIRQGTDGNVKVIVVADRFTPVLKEPGEKVIDSQITTPEVIIRLGTGLRSVFRSKESVVREAKAQYDAEWKQYYKQMDAEVDRILAKG